jgi:hypothetical protein
MMSNNCVKCSCLIYDAGPLCAACAAIETAGSRREQPELAHPLETPVLQASGQTPPIPDPRELIEERSSPSGQLVGDRFRRLALAYRTLVRLYGVALVLALVRLTVRSTPGMTAHVIMVLVSVIALCTGAALIVFGYRTAEALDSGSPLLWAMAMVVPFLNVAVLLVLSRRSTRMCRAVGIPVGFLGPRLAPLAGDHEDGASRQRRWSARVPSAVWPLSIVVVVALIGFGIFMSARSGNDSAGGSTSSVEKTYTAAAGRYSVDLRSDPSDYIGGGKTYSYTSANADVSVIESGGHLTITVNGRHGFVDNWWTGDFQEPSRLHELKKGSYKDLERYPFGDRQKGSFDWIGEGRGSNELTGWFAIDRLSRTNGDLSAIHLRFELHCEGGGPALRGQIRLDELTRDVESGHGRSVLLASS